MQKEKGAHGFYIVPGGEGPTFEDFENFPVWSEHYDYDEIEEIVSWGIDPAWLNEQFRKHDDGSAHCHYPVLQTTPRLPARMRMSVKADFVTAGGRSLKGVVDQYMGCLGVCYEDQEYGFQSYFPELPEVAEKSLIDLRRLRQKLGEEDPIFPIRFTTGFINSEGEPIEGFFSPTLPEC
jgi:hypothetical protein